MTINGFIAYVKQLWKNKPDTSTPLSAERLTHMESGIKGNSDAIEKIAAAVVSQISNDPDKIANMAALYAVQQAAFLKANVVSQIVNDSTKAASMAALYSVNKRVDDTNSNLNTTKIAFDDLSKKTGFDGVGKVTFAQNSTAMSIRFYTTAINYLYIEFLTTTKNIKFGFYNGSTWTDYWIM